eukprot:SAG31_NODE_32616_length_353_cov_1.074803_1_plen_64_part_01
MQFGTAQSLRTSIVRMLRKCACGLAMESYSCISAVTAARSSTAAAAPAARAPVVTRSDYAKIYS